MNSLKMLIGLSLNTMFQKHVGCIRLIYDDKIHLNETLHLISSVIISRLLDIHHQTVIKLFEVKCIHKESL